jgi:hypothetical protein
MLPTAIRCACYIFGHLFLRLPSGALVFIATLCCGSCFELALLRVKPFSASSCRPQYPLVRTVALWMCLTNSMARPSIVRDSRGGTRKHHSCNRCSVVLLFVCRLIVIESLDRSFCYHARCGSSSCYHSRCGRSCSIVSPGRTLFGGTICVVVTYPCWSFQLHLAVLHPRSIRLPSWCLLASSPVTWTPCRLLTIVVNTVAASSSSCCSSW